MATIKFALDAGASVVVMSHLGRPTEGQYVDEFSLAPVAQRLGQLLGRNVPLLAQPEDCPSIDFGEIGLLENVRFLAGEKSNSAELSQRLADQCDVFVMDAFGTAHRAHASTHGVAERATTACAGLLLDAELKAFQTTLSAPQKPMVSDYWRGQGLDQIRSIRLAGRYCRSHYCGRRHSEYVYCCRRLRHW